MHVRRRPRPPHAAAPAGARGAGSRATRSAIAGLGRAGRQRSRRRASAAYATSPAPHHAGAPADRDLDAARGRPTRGPPRRSSPRTSPTAGARRMAAAVPGVLEELPARRGAARRDRPGHDDRGGARSGSRSPPTSCSPRACSCVPSWSARSSTSYVPSTACPRPRADPADLRSGARRTSRRPSAAPTRRCGSTPSHYRSASVSARTVGDRAGRRVYVTLGTIFNKTSGDLFERLRRRARGPRRRGRRHGRARPRPGGTRCAPRPTSASSGSCRRTRCWPRRTWSSRHGGSGSLMAALAHGLPSRPAPAGRRPAPQRAARPRSSASPRPSTPPRPPPPRSPTASWAPHWPTTRWPSGAARWPTRSASLPSVDVRGGAARARSRHLGCGHDDRAHRPRDHRDGR